MDLMESLVDSMSIDHIGYVCKSDVCKKKINFLYRIDYLAPESNYNPIDWRVKTATKRAAVNPSAPLPELDERFDHQLYVNPIIIDKIGDLGEQIGKKFNVVKGTRGQMSFITVYQRFF